MSKESEDREVLNQIYAAFFAGELDLWLTFWTEESDSDSDEDINNKSIVLILIMFNIT